jgi:hypothetical protein
MAWGSSLYNVEVVLAAFMLVVARSQWEDLLQSLESLAIDIPGPWRISY